MRLTRRDLVKGGLATGSALLIPGLAGRAAAATLPTLRVGGPTEVGPYLALSGSLHDHSTDSDGDSSSEAITMWVHAHRAELGLDYAILSDHSDFFPTSPYRTEQQPTAEPTPSWIRQAELDAAYSQGGDFTYLRGFEWTNDQENHLNVLFSTNWTSRFTDGDAALTMGPFWQWFDTVPATADVTGTGVVYGGGDGLGQFNHPGDKGALNWDDYAPDAAALQRMCTIEVHGDQGHGGRGSSDAGWYWFALAQGWLVGPVMNWDYHVWGASGVLSDPVPGAGYGGPAHPLPGQRSIVFATAPTARALRAAIAARRTAASELPDAWAALLGPAGEWMGSTISAEPGSTITITVEAGSPTESLSHVQIVGDNGVSPYPDYYGDNFTDGVVQLPVGGEDNPPGAADSQLLPGYTEQHARYLASGGHATRKGRIDAPPGGTVMASMPMTGTRQQVSIPVTIPTAPSPRPDGAHFLYAIVYAGPAADRARIWTAPLLVTPAATAALPESREALVLPAAGLAVAAAYAVHRRGSRPAGSTHA